MHGTQELDLKTPFLERQESNDSGPRNLNLDLKPSASRQEDKFAQALNDLGYNLGTVWLRGKAGCACSCKAGAVIGMEDGSLCIVHPATESPTFSVTHENPVSVLSSAGEIVVSGSTAGTVKVWDIASMQEVSTFQGHESPVTCLAIAPTDKYIVSGSDDHTVRLWWLKQKSEQALPIGLIMTLPSRRQFASNSLTEAAIKIPNSKEEKDGIILRHDGPVNCVAVSADSKYVVSGSMDSTVKVWNIEEAKEVSIFEGHTDPVTCVVIAKDGKRIFSGSLDKTVKMWSVEEPKVMETLQHHNEKVTCLSYLEEKQQVISGSYDKTVKIWDIKEKKEVVLNNPGPVSCLLLLPDGKHFATGTSHRKVAIWKFGEDKEVALLQTEKPVLQLTVMGSNQLVILGTHADSVTVWKLEEAKETVVLSGHTDSIISVTMLSDNQRMASVSADHTVRIWSAEKAEQLDMFQEGNSHMAFYSSLTFSVKHSFTRSCKSRSMTSQGFQELVRKRTCKEITPDGKQLLVGSYNGTVKLWELEGWIERTTIENGHAGVSCMSLSSDGKHVVTGSTDAVIRILSLDKSTEVVELEGHEKRVTCVQMLPDGDILISGSEDKTVKIWKLAKSEDKYNIEKVATLRGHTEKVTCLAYMNNKNPAVTSKDKPTTKRTDIVVSGSKDKTIKVWSLKNLEEVATLQGHTGFVTCVSVSLDGEYIFSGARDNTVRIWSLREAREIAIIKEHTGWVTCLSLSIDGFYIISGSNDNTLCRTDLRLKIPEYRSKYLESVKDIGVKSYYFSGQYRDNLAHGDRISLSVAALPVLPFYFNSLHICAHHNQSIQLEYYLKNEVPIIRSKFGSPLTIALKRNTIKCVNVMLTHLTETCQTPSGFFAVQEITDDFPNLLKCNSPCLVPFLKMLLIQQTQPGLPEFILPRNPLPITLFKEDRFILLKDFAQVKNSTTINQSKEGTFADQPQYLTLMEHDDDTTTTDQDGEVVKFLVSLFRWNFKPGSDKSLEFLRAMERCEDKHILTTPLITSLVQSKWDKLLLIARLHTLLYLCLLLCLIGMAFNYYRFDILSIAFIWLNVFFLLYEIVQSIANRSEYWKDVWNYVDLLRGGLSITWGYLMYSGVGHLHYLNFAVVCMCFFRGFTFFRTFKMTRMFVRMTIEVVKDMYAFLVILGYSTCSFGMMYAVLAPETITSASGAWITAYELLMGTYNNDGFGLVRWLCFTAASLVNVIIMLNLLISILGDAYEKAQMSASENDTLEMLSLVIEYESMFFWRRKAKDSSVLIVCKSSAEDDTEEKWAGRIGEIQKIVAKNGLNLELKMKVNIDLKVKEMEKSLMENKLVLEANKAAIENLSAKLDQVLAARQASQ